mgnify:CR=1 FL=1
MSISIKDIVLKTLMESTEPAFYLAPDVVGSINNAYPDKGRKRFVVDFNTVDQIPMKLMVPFKTYSDWHTSNIGNQTPIQNFLTSFLNGVKPCDQNDMLGDMADEFGNLFDDSDDKPANIKGSPGYYNNKSGMDALNQRTSRQTTIFSPNLGYGAVVW